MKTLNNFITEKLKLNQNSKPVQYNQYNQLTIEIVEFLYNTIQDALDEEITIIEEWIKTNNIKSINIISTEKIFKDFYHMDENDMTIQDLIDKYENIKDIKLTLISDWTYDKLNNIGKKVWQDKYGWVQILIDGNFLIYESRSVGKIFFKTYK